MKTKIKHFIGSFQGQKLTFKKATFWLGVFFIAYVAYTQFYVMPDARQVAEYKIEIQEAKDKVWNSADDSSFVKESYNEGLEEFKDIKTDNANKWDALMRGGCPQS